MPGNHDIQFAIGGKDRIYSIPSVFLETPKTTTALDLTSDSFRIVDSTGDKIYGETARMQSTSQPINGVGGKLKHYPQIIKGLIPKSGSWKVYVSYYDRQQLKNLKAAFSETQEFTVYRKTGKVEIKADIEIIPVLEGFGSICTALQSQLVRKGHTLVLDIGGGTVGGSIYSEKLELLAYKYFEGEGTQELSKMIHNDPEFRTITGDNRRFRKCLPNLQKAIQNSGIYDEGGRMDLSELIERHSIPYLMGLMEAFQDEFSGVMSQCKQVIITGGGGELYRVQLSQQPGYIVLTDSQRADANGLLQYINSKA